MKGYTHVNDIYANKPYRRPVNQYESDSSMTNKVDDTNLMLLVFLKEVGNLSLITFGNMKKLTPISKSLHFNALKSSQLNKFSMFYLQMNFL